MSRRNTKRCGSCKHTWDPKGKGQSTHCPNCNSTDIRFVINNPNAPSEEEATPVAAHPPPVIPPIFDAWDDNTPQFKSGHTSAQLSGPASHRASRTASQQRRSTPQKAPPKKGAMGFGMLFLIVVAVLGTLLWIRTEGRLFGLLNTYTDAENAAPKRRRPQAIPQRCKTIVRRYRHAAKMEKKSPRKWKKWRQHWENKAKQKSCDLPDETP